MCSEQNRTGPKCAERKNMKNYIVNEEENGKRLDVYIASKDEEITRSSAQRQIERGNVVVNGKVITKVSYKVTEGDNIDIEEQ